MSSASSPAPSETARGAISTTDRFSEESASFASGSRTSLLHRRRPSDSTTPLLAKDFLDGMADKDGAITATASEEGEWRENEDVLDSALAKKVLRKIDLRLIPLLFVTYNLNFIDKTST